ncbi:MAG: hypothetical protein ACREBS_02700 [Nitrososphaerales archaeon]
MQKENGVIAHDYGTNCVDCERYKTLGDVCVIEHEKKFLWEYCRDFVPKVVMPDYRELMRSVRQDQALERKKIKEKKEREKRKKLKERIEREALRKKERRARLRRIREKKKLKELKIQQREARKKKVSIQTPAKAKKIVTENKGDVSSSLRDKNDHVRKSKKTNNNRQKVARDSNRAKTSSSTPEPLTSGNKSVQSK